MDIGHIRGQLTEAECSGESKIVCECWRYCGQRNGSHIRRLVASEWSEFDEHGHNGVGECNTARAWDGAGRVYWGGEDGADRMRKDRLVVRHIGAVQCESEREREWENVCKRRSAGWEWDFRYLC